MIGKVVCLLGFVLGVQSQCNFPPSLWCSSVEIAKQCQVLEQCDEVSTHDAAAPLVNFTLYYESLCPGCRQFITEMMFPAFKSIGQIVNMSLVPYGNARETKEGNRWVFECQHGKQECIGNIIETCAINILKDMKNYFPFINCIEESEDPERAAKQCGQKFAIDLDPILNCSKSDLGNRWEHEMAVRTDALQPPHEYTPWVTLNGESAANKTTMVNAARCAVEMSYRTIKTRFKVHTNKIQDEAETNLLKLICDTYMGTKPPGCTSHDHTYRHSMK